ncbi:MAG: hypothetical protein MJE66_04595 [Proteobacteria bacterium]|nr:hypothetical protein [Pseudomonadota bacterium]
MPTDAAITARALAERVSLAPLAPVVEAALARSPQPDRAPPLLETLLDGLAGADCLAPFLAQDAAGLERVLTVCSGHAPFLAARLARHPDWWSALTSDQLREPRDAEALARDLSLALADGADADALRRFKYRELCRITLRECDPELVPPEREAEILAELSHLADALLAESLALALARVEERYGPPVWTVAGQPQRLALCVLGLGKLGSEELNYSSDVDLVYVHESPAEPPVDGPGGEAPAPYFDRVAREFGGLVTSATTEGFLYRVDLDLRPEGAQGPVVISAAGLETYFEAWAHTWEKAAYMKARPVAGDPALGWRVVRSLAPMLYRSSMDLSGVRGIRELKEKVERARSREGDPFDVKTGTGGIRDVEFVAQALQLLHGGRILQLRERGTQRSLEELGQVGLLPRERVESLLADYRWMRRVENRLQMEAERQTHRVPEEPERVRRLARTLGDAGDGAEARFRSALAACRERVRAALAESFPETDSSGVQDAFARYSRRFAGFSGAEALLEQLAGAFSQCIEQSPNPERALNNLERFLASAGAKPTFIELLLDRPELVPRLARLFGTSQFLSEILSRHPSLIEPVFDDPDVLLLSRQQLREDHDRLLREFESEGRAGTELALDTLRLFHHRQVVNVGLLELGEKIGLDQVEAALTDLAEVCTERALEFAHEQSAARAPRSGDYLIVGMGKLGCHALSYGSDLDLIFLYDAEALEPAERLEAQDHFVRLTQRFISALQTPTAAGRCYEIDARLRPSGNQGLLVTSLAAFERYHESGAQVWERQALLRARAVAGSAELAERFEALRRHILVRPLSEDAAHEVHRIRMRMQRELARESAQRHDFKTGRGGVLDVESVVQYLQLVHGAQHPDLLAPVRMEQTIEALERVGALAADAAGTLRAGWLFFRALGSRLRIAENRSISDLDEERGDLDSLARSLGYSGTGREGGERRALLADYRRHTEAVRSAYRQTFPFDDSE